MCVALVYVMIVLCSRRAIVPVIQASERQKQFITDASHELKTPITVIATSLKMLDMEVGQQKWIDKAGNQTEKLTELVMLSRMDEEASPLQMADFPVSDALAETAESFRDFAASAGHTLDVRVTPGMTYCGDEYAIRQLVSILLDNAVKYAVPDTPIVFSLEKGRRGVVIRTENQCDALDTAALGRLFDRFLPRRPRPQRRDRRLRHRAVHRAQHRRGAPRHHPRREPRRAHDRVHSRAEIGLDK